MLTAMATRTTNTLASNSQTEDSQRSSAPATSFPLLARHKELPAGRPAPRLYIPMAHWLEERDVGRREHAQCGTRRRFIQEFFGLRLPWLWGGSSAE
ncbi:hypothetical protein NDU88_001349 [Pleurodeles waltl]|uniref:Uncharacterized protein n=1 Tax=Pleurodeles waltl TaxID=8319 RepID=A0AAV7S8B6_PLEWA|nr:hypothetical protein NDU88_001349 [Pleurodeles waltl]